MERRGERWHSVEETLLLGAIKRGVQIKCIAETHQRSIGGIHARLKLIAQRLLKEGIDIEVVACKTGISINELKMDSFQPQPTVVNNMDFLAEVEQRLQVAKEGTASHKFLTEKRTHLLDMLKKPDDFDIDCQPD